MKKIDVLLMLLIAISIGMLLFGAYLALIASPPDFKQLDAVRIMYVHVPSAIMSMFSYGFLAIFCGLHLWRKNYLWYLLANAIAPIGTIFTLICLITGSIWGKPMWGTYWSWDPRLTSELILLFIFFAYMALNTALEELRKRSTIVSVWAIVGAINLPIIKYSVTWWHSIHQGPSIMKIGGHSDIDPAMLVPLGVMMIAVTLTFITLSALNFCAMWNQYQRQLNSSEV